MYGVRERERRHPQHPRALTLPATPPRATLPGTISGKKRQAGTDPAVPRVSALARHSSCSLLFPTGLRAGMVPGSHGSSVLAEQHGARIPQPPVSAGRPPASPGYKGKDQHHLQWAMPSAMGNAICNDQRRLQWPMPFAPANTGMSARGRAAPWPSWTRSWPAVFQSLLLSPIHSSHFGTPPGTREQVPFGSAVFGGSRAASPPPLRWVTSSPSPSWGGTSSGASAEQNWKRETIKKPQKAA